MPRAFLMLGGLSSSLLSFGMGSQNASTESKSDDELYLLQSRQQVKALRGATAAAISDDTPWRLPTIEEVTAAACGNFSAILKNEDNIQDIVKASIPSADTSGFRQALISECQFSDDDSAKVMDLLFASGNGENGDGDLNECCLEQTGIIVEDPQLLSALRCVIAAPARSVELCCKDAVVCEDCIMGSGVVVWAGLAFCRLRYGGDLSSYQADQYFDCWMKDRFRIKDCPEPEPPAPGPPPQTTSTTTCPPIPRAVTEYEFNHFTVTEDCNCFCYNEANALGLKCVRGNGSVEPCCSTQSYCAGPSESGLRCSSGVVLEDAYCAKHSDNCENSGFCNGIWCPGPGEFTSVLQKNPPKAYCILRGNTQSDCGPWATVLADDCSKDKTTCETSGFCSGYWCEAPTFDLTKDLWWMTTPGFCDVNQMGGETCGANAQVSFDACSKDEDTCTNSGFCSGQWCYGPAPYPSLSVQSALQFVNVQSQCSPLQSLSACGRTVRCQPMFCPDRAVPPRPSQHNGQEIKWDEVGNDNDCRQASQAPARVRKKYVPLELGDGTWEEYFVCEETFSLPTLPGQYVTCTRESNVCPIPWGNGARDPKLDSDYQGVCHCLVYKSARDPGHQRHRRLPPTLFGEPIVFDAP
jgi:hypothetical protein